MLFRYLTHHLELDRLFPASDFRELRQRHPEFFVAPNCGAMVGSLRQEDR